MSRRVVDTLPMTKKGRLVREPLVFEPEAAVPEEETGAHIKIADTAPP